MRSSTILSTALLTAAAALASPAAPRDVLTPLSSNNLRRVLTRSALLSHAEKLQSFADKDPSRNRGFGGVGHRLTVDYIYDTLTAPGSIGDYYNVTKQAFVHEYAAGESKFSAEGQNYESIYFTYSPSSNGSVEGLLAPVKNFGCERTDFPKDISGKIAFISRGTCDFGIKISHAGGAGAAGAIIYNNVPGPVPGGTLGSPSRPQGPYVPCASISQADANSLLTDIAAGPVTGTLSVNAILENRTTHNVIAESKQGSKSTVIVSGGHTDSVGAGPGINDDGSGALGLLEIASKLPSFGPPKNAIRFGFWSAEEFGLVGSKYYVSSLDPASAQRDIALYLNFDMIASPNYVYFVYDGSGRAFNKSGPPGSAHIEQTFIDYFDSNGLSSRPTEFSGRSDYGPFLDANIPSGGLFTGAEAIKTASEAEAFGGVAGEAYDENYHKSGDTIKNLDMTAWIQNTKAAADAIVKYSLDLEGVPERKLAVGRRAVDGAKKELARCGHVILEM